MSTRRMLIYAALMVVGVAGALWIADTSKKSSLHDYAAQNAERKKQHAGEVELSEAEFPHYVEYAFLFSVKKYGDGKFPVRLQAGVCLATERAKTGQSSEPWTALVAKVVADMVVGAQISTATPDEAAAHRDNPIVQDILKFGEFESMVATIETYRERVGADTLAAAVPNPETEAALRYGTELREAFVRDLTSHPAFRREFRAHLQRVSEDPNYPLPSIKWVR